MGAPFFQRVHAGVVEADDCLQHSELFVHGRVRIDLVEGVLVQKVLPKRLGGFQHHTLLPGKRVYTHQAHHLPKLILFLQKAHGLNTQSAPFVVETVIPVGVERFRVKGIAGKPVDGREVPLIR